MGVGGQRHAPATLTLVRGPSTHCARAGWIAGGVEKRKSVACNGAGAPKPPALSESLYQLPYSGTQ